MSGKNIILVIALAIVALFAIYVWPTRFIYSTEKAGEYTHVVRIDRFSDRVWVLSPEGWKERSTLDMTTFKPLAPASDPYAPYGGHEIQSQTQNPIDASAQHTAVPAVSKPKPTQPKRWATVNEDTSVFKHCHFEAGNTNVEGCDYVMAFSDPYPSAIVVLKKGDRVELLSGSTRASGAKEIYKVRFGQWTGWMDAADLTPE